MRHPRSSVWRGLCSGLSVRQCQAFPASNTPSVDRSAARGHHRERAPAKFPLRTWEPVPACCLHQAAWDTLPWLAAANHSLSILFFTRGSRRGPSLRGRAPDVCGGVPPALAELVGRGGQSHGGGSGSRLGTPTPACLHHLLKAPGPTPGVGLVRLRSRLLHSLEPGLAEFQGDLGYQGYWAAAPSWKLLGLWD